MNRPDDDDLRDDRLRRALDNAPDHAVAPDWRLRKAILRQAHEAVGVVDDAMGLEAPRTVPVWQRLLGLGGGARMPWNAAFATVLVAVLVTVLWQREPTPGPRADATADPAGTVAALPPTASAPSAAAGPDAQAPAPMSESAEVAEPGKASPLPAPAAASKAAVDDNRPLPSVADYASGTLPSAPEPPLLAAPIPPVAVAPAPSIAEAVRSAPGLSTDGAAPAARQRYEAPSASAVPGLLPGETGALPPPGAMAAGGPRQAAAPEPPAMPSFSALSEFSRLTIKPRDGASLNLARTDARDLGALLGSVAITATLGKALAGPVEWRITFERNSEMLAVLEIGRRQVRWREKGVPPVTGEPSAAALAAVRSSLQATVQSHATPAPETSAPTQDARSSPQPQSPPPPRSAGATRPEPSPAPPVASTPPGAQESPAEPSSSATPSRRVIRSGIPGVPDIVINPQPGASGEAPAR